jgi:hypothetical protein
MSPAHLGGHDMLVKRRDSREKLMGDASLLDFE